MHMALLHAPHEGTVMVVALLLLRFASSFVVAFFLGNVFLSLYIFFLRMVYWYALLLYFFFISHPVTDVHAHKNSLR